MATLTTFSSIDMSDSIFIENEALTTVNGTLSARTDNTGTGKQWDWDGAGIAGHQDTPNSTHWIVDQGTITSSEYRVGGNVAFEILGIPGVQADLVWNAFEQRENASVFGLLLIGDDRVLGSDFNDTMGGYDGADVLLGGLGIDRLNGGAGDDTLKGAADNDRLAGGAGDDRLEGGVGKDQLTGGGGADAFVFNTAPRAGAADTITDFHAGLDKILLDNDVLAGIGNAGALRGDRFFGADNVGPDNTPAGLTPDDRILYDRDSGKLYYDSNGSDGAHRVLLATVLHDGAPVSNLSPTDFIVF